MAEIQYVIDRLRSKLRGQDFPISETEFFESFFRGPERLIDHEGDLWDYKLEWPFSQSDEYFQGLAKLGAAFANTYGGLIIFNVFDDTKTFKASKVNPNSDVFFTALKNRWELNPRLDYRQYERNGMKFPIVAVYPRKANELPVVYRPPKSDLRKWMVRDGYEKVEATAEHAPILFCRAQIRTNGLDTSIAEISLPPSPATLPRAGSSNAGSYGVAFSGVG